MPAYFNDAQRQATKDAGKIAGLEVLRIINEPTAAALAYGLDKKGQETVLVFDLGGGTFDVSHPRRRRRRRRGAVHERRRAPRRRRLRQAHRRLARRRVQGGPGHRPAQRPAGAAAALRGRGARQGRAVAPTTTTQISLPFITADADGPEAPEHVAARARSSSSSTADLVERCRGPVEQALSDAKLTADDIDEVILVGGSTRIPAVQELVRRLTGGKDPNMTVNPDEVVADRRGDPGRRPQGRGRGRGAARRHAAVARPRDAWAA